MKEKCKKEKILTDFKGNTFPTKVLNQDPKTPEKWLLRVVQINPKYTTKMIAKERKRVKKVIMIWTWW